MGYATTNPYTGEVVREFRYATDAQVDAALEAGHAAFQFGDSGIKEFTNAKVISTAGPGQLS